MLLVVVGFWFVLQIRPQSAGKLLESTQACPAPEGIGLTATPGQKQAVQPYPAPSQVPTPEPTKATKPPVCKFPNPEAAPKQILRPIDRYQFSEPKIVFTSKAAIGIAGWLPDGERLLITRSVGNGRETIETLDIRTGETVVYAEREGAAGKPVWIDDLNAVAFATSVKDRQELWISYGKTNERDIIAADVTGWSLANDRDRVVYFSPSIGDIPQIWDSRSKLSTAINADLSKWKYSKLPNNVCPAQQGKTFSAALQPNGTKMAFFGRAWFFIFDTTTEDICEIDLGKFNGIPVSVLRADWSRDGRYIAMRTSAFYPGDLVPFSNVVVIDFATGKQFTVPLTVPFVYDIAWSVNNQFLAMLGADQSEYKRGSSASRFFLTNILEEAPPKIVFDRLFGGGATDDWQLNWSPDGEKIAVKCSTWLKTQVAITDDHICIIEILEKP